MKKNQTLKFLLLLSVFCWPLQAITFFSNPENTQLYKGYGLYPSNKFVYKILLNDNWQVRLEGEDNWQNIYIPSAFYDSYLQNKKVYFRTSFYLRGDRSLEDRHYKLVFYGVNYSCNIKVNGNFVENHNSGYNSFEIDLNNNLLKFNAMNHLVVEVSNKLLLNKTIPMQMQVNGWRNYGGIFRDVFLVVSSQIAVADASIKYNLENNYTNANVEVNAKVKDYNFIKINESDTLNYTSDIQAYLEVHRKNDNALVYQSEKVPFEIKKYSEQSVKFNFKLPNVKLWSPDLPELYQVSLYLSKNVNGQYIEFNQHDFNCGFRELKILDGKFYLNGQIFKVKGLTRFEDVKGMGSAITYGKMNQDIERIKNLGVNLLHTTHAPPHPYILDLCDKYGIFMIEEIPLKSIPPLFLDKKEFVELARDNISDMISRDKNHPAVFAWNLGGGYNVFDQRSVAFLREMSTLAKNITPGIFTSFDSKLSSHQEYFRITDINLINLPNDGVNDEFMEKLQFVNKKRAVIINNIGKTIYANNENGFQDPKSEPAQAKFIISNIRELERTDYLNGTIIDSYRDRMSDVPLLTSVPNQDAYRFNNGLVDYDGKERIAYRAVEAIYKDRRAPSLNQGEFQEEQNNLYFFLGLLLTALLIYMAKREHYLRLNIMRCLKNSDAFFIDVRDKRITQVWYSLLIGVLTALGVSSMLSSVFYYYRTSEELDFLISLFIGNNIVKEYFIDAAWNPYQFIFFSTLIILAGMFVLSLYVKMLSFLFNNKYSLSISTSMVFWNSIVFLVYLPLSTFFLRIINKVVLEIWIFISFLLFSWMAYRFIQLMAVSFKTSMQRIIWINFVVIALITILFIYFSGINLDSLAYLGYYFDVFME